MRVVVITVMTLGAVLTSAWPTGPTTRQAAAQQPAVTVDMRDFAFEPRDVMLPAGGAVRWVNRDDTRHSIVMEGNQPGSSRGAIAPGGEHTFVFPQPGRFTYRCGVHPTMLGEVVVSGP